MLAPTSTIMWTLGGNPAWVTAQPHMHSHAIPHMPFLCSCSSACLVSNCAFELQYNELDVPTSLAAALHAEDQASNLLWRLQNGQVFVKHNPKVAIVLIGINDLGAGGSCGRGEPGATAAANGTALRSICCLALCLALFRLPVLRTQDSGLSTQCSVLSAQCCSPQPSVHKTSSCTNDQPTSLLAG